MEVLIQQHLIIHVVLIMTPSQLTHVHAVMEIPRKPSTPLGNHFLKTSFYSE